MKIILLLTGIIIILALTLTVIISDHQKIQSSYDSLLAEKLQVKEIIETFKEKYSEQEITEYFDSKGIPYKYSSKTGVDLILEKDRIVLRAWTNDGDTLCIVSNPLPRDILDNCPPKW